MAVVAFDTLKFANSLKEAGVPPAQAEAQARLFGEAFQVNLKDLVTKDDLKQAIAESELRIVNKLDAQNATLTNKIDQGSAEAKNLRTELKGDINLLRWICGANTGLLIAVLIRLFFYFPR